MLKCCFPVAFEKKPRLFEPPSLRLQDDEERSRQVSIFSETT